MSRGTATLIGDCQRDVVDLYAAPAAIAAFSNLLNEPTSGALELPSVKKSFLRRVQPSTNLFLTEAPLPAHFQRRNFSTFRPEAHGSWGYTQPSRNGRSGKKHIVSVAPWIKHYRTAPKLKGGDNSSSTTKFVRTDFQKSM
jgi:hypothetical protein